MTTFTRPPAATQHPRNLAKWAPLAVVMAGTFMFVLDFFVVNVALPAVQHDLGAGSGAIEWIVAGYALTTATFLVVGGRLGDRYGRRRVFALGLVVFVIASAACGLAPESGVLIGMRLAQGLGAALMAPNVLSILGVVYSGADRVRAISIYGMVMGVAATGGQLLGGAIVAAAPGDLGWRLVFWLNVPIGLVALWAAKVIPESRGAGPTGDGGEAGGPRRARLDVLGAAALTAGLVALLLPLVEGRAQGWPAWSWLCLAAAPVLLGGFAAYERRLASRGGTPLLAGVVFTSRPLQAGLAVQLLFWCQQSATYLFLALYLQHGRGESAFVAGAVFAVLAAGYFVTSLRAPALTVRYGRRVVMVGALMAAIGDVALFAAVGEVGVAGTVAAVFPGLFLLGAGQGLCITPLTTTVLSHVDAATAGSVAGTLSTMQQVGNAIGVAAVGVVFFGGESIGASFAHSVGLMGLLLVGVAALSRLLPGGGRSAAG